MKYEIILLGAFAAVAAAPMSACHGVVVGGGLGASCDAATSCRDPYVCAHDGICRESCKSNADCQGGRVCDLGNYVCVAAMTGAGGSSASSSTGTQSTGTQSTTTVAASSSTGVGGMGGAGGGGMGGAGGGGVGGAGGGGPSSGRPLALGGQHTCAINNGMLSCWGWNANGQLGDGTTTDHHSPVPVGALGSGVAEVAAGGIGAVTPSPGHTCARKLDGTLWCWGANGNGQLGDGTTMDKHLPVQVVALGNKVAEIAAGGATTCARKLDGTLWCWGNNMYGQLGNGTTTDSSVPVQVTALAMEVAQVAVADNHTCARKLDGSLWCWGLNQYGGLGDGTTTNKSLPVSVLANVAQAAVGQGWSCARKTDGTLWCWGYNAFGEVGDGTTTEKDTPAQVSALGVMVAGVAGGLYYHNCAIKTNGTIWCWGKNNVGQLGDGTTTNQSTPVQAL